MLDFIFFICYIRCMKQDLIKVKGSNDKIILYLDNKAPLEEIEKAILSLLPEALPLLSSNKIIINMGKRVDIHPILNRIVDRFADLKLKLKEIIIDFSQDEHGLSKTYKPDDNPSTTILKKTVRSGQKITNNGDLIIFGDVNPGGEVSATGNITILGDVRGVVHAGSDGNLDACIIGYRIAPLQLRIGNYMIRGEEFIKMLKNKSDNLNEIKIIYVDNGEFKITRDFSRVREVGNEG